MNKTQTHPYLKAKIQIGNSQGPVSYNLKQTVFHHDDVPEDRRQRRQEIKNYLKSKVLSTERAGWNKSTDPNVPVCERRKMENFVNDRSKAMQYNYRAESLDCLKQTEPIDRPTKHHVSTQLESTALKIKSLKENDRIQRGMFARTGEMPVHPNLVNEPSWNNSTFFHRTDKDKKLDEITDKAHIWTDKVNANLGKTKKYNGPLKSVILLQEEIRRQKAEGIFSADRQVNRPASEPVDRRKLRNRFAIEKIHKVKYTEHSGVWEQNKLDGRSMWSDTGSQDFDSKGDIVKTVNLDAYNFEGPNMSNRKLLKPLNKHHHHTTTHGHNNNEHETGHQNPSSAGK